MKPFLSTLTLLLLLTASASAYQLRTGDTTNLLAAAAGETYDDEALLVAHDIDFQGDARRDLWLLATTAIRFGGAADGDLRALANSTLIDGLARQNLLAYARGLHLTTNSVVRGQAALLGSTVICEGQVDGDAWILAQSVTLGGQWGGNVRVQATEIRVVPGTRIAGDLVHTSASPLVLDPSVTVGGTVKTARAVGPEAPAASADALRARLALHGYLFLAALLAGMPFVGAFPLAAGGAVRHLRSSPWRVLLAGALTLLLGPFLVGLSLMTIVGAPLALLLGALYLSLAYLSHIVIALWLGHRLLRSEGPQTFAKVLSSMGLGLFLLYFAAAIPGVASFLLLPVVLLGTGSLVLAILRRPFVAVPIPPPPPPPLPGPPETPVE